MRAISEPVHILLWSNTSPSAFSCHSPLFHLLFLGWPKVAGHSGVGSALKWLRHWSTGSREDAVGENSHLLGLGFQQFLVCLFGWVGGSLLKRNVHGEVVLLSVLPLQATLCQTGCHEPKLSSPSMAGFVNMAGDVLEFLLSPRSSGIWALY